MITQTEKVEAATARLERNEIVVRQDIAHTQELLIRIVADIELEMHALQQELVSLDAEMQRTTKRAKQVVGQYRNVVKKGDLARLQNRIDVWAPEKRLTREQFQLMF